LVEAENFEMMIALHFRQFSSMIYSIYHGVTRIFVFQIFVPTQEDIEQTFTKYEGPKHDIYDIIDL